MPETPRTRFGKYLIESKVAVGGMAEIYRGYTTSGDAVAIKLIHPNYASQQKFIQMFLDEASIVVSLRHPNIVQLMDFGKVGETYFFSMEWIDGKPLSNIIKRQLELKLRFPVDAAILTAIDLCEGLAYAHSRRDRFNRPMGIVHRDISPPNILVSKDTIVKIADFGIADAKNKGAQTKPGVIRGKFSYMSPEQTFAEPLDNRSDIFSLGIVLWELLAGRRLFLTDEDLQTVAAVRRCEIPRLREIRSDVPEALEKAVMKSLAKSRDKRFKSADELSTVLRTILKKNFSTATRQTLSDFIGNLFPNEGFHVDPSKEPVPMALEIGENTAGGIRSWMSRHPYGVSAGAALMAVAAAEVAVRTLR